MFSHRGHLKSAKRRLKHTNVALPCPVQPQPSTDSIGNMHHQLALHLLFHSRSCCLHTPPATPGTKGVKAHTMRCDNEVRHWSTHTSKEVPFQGEQHAAPLQEPPAKSATPREGLLVDKHTSYVLLFIKQQAVPSQHTQHPFSATHTVTTHTMIRATHTP
jgi:hypothetical protein